MDKDIFVYEQLLNCFNGYVDANCSVMIKTNSARNSTVGKDNSFTN